MTDKVTRERIRSQEDGGVHRKAAEVTERRLRSQKDCLGPTRIAKVT